jgi:hypothetical protein
MISTSSTFSSVLWEAYTPSKAWNLTPGDGLKKLYACYRDRAENMSPNYSATIYLDTKAPTTPSTPAGQGSYSNSDLIAFTWGLASDTGSGIKEYHCQIGRSPNANDLFDGYVGNTLSKAIGVAGGTSCFCRVRAVDKAGNTSAWTASSPGTTRVNHILDNISEAKALTNGDSVGLSGKTVTAVFDGCIYIEELNRSAGIKVVPVDGVPPAMMVGSTVNVGGTLAISPNDERYILGTVQEQLKFPDTAPLSFWERGRE